MTRLPFAYLKLRCICLLIGLCFSQTLLIESANSSDFTIHIVETDRLITEKQGDDSLNLVFISYLVNELSNIGLSIVEINANDRDERSKTSRPKHNDRHNLNLTVYTRFIRIGENQFIPSLELITDKNNRTLASFKTIPIRTGSETHSLYMQIESAAISLARMAFKRLQTLNWGEIQFAAENWEDSSQRIGLRTIGFTGCLERHLIEVIGEEFPGSKYIQLRKAGTSGLTIYDWQTQAKINYNAKWLNALLTELGFTEASDFKIEIERRYIRIKMFIAKTLQQKIC
jgi:hypothetical protein